MMTNVATTLNERIASLAKSMGYEFVGLELQNQGHSAILRIYIDKENGVTVSDCSQLSRQVSAMLDVEDPIQGHYSLEVSSPGLDRPLFELAHYQQQIGNNVKVRLRAAVNNRRKYTGILLRVSGDDVHLLVGAEEIVLPFSTIEKANVIADIR